MDFKAPGELWNPLSKAVPGKFHRSGGHSKWNFLQDRASFQVSGMTDYPNLQLCNIMPVDALAACVARSSAAMILTMSDKWFLVFHQQEFQLPQPSYCQSNWHLTCWIVLKIIKDVFTFHIIPWILFIRRRPDSRWSNPTCCLSKTVNTKAADALATEVARSPAGMVLTK